MKPYQIIIEFPTKELGEAFCGQMSDGFGEGLCDFSFHRRLPGTDGTKNEHYERVVQDGKKVFFVNSIEEF